MKEMCFKTFDGLIMSFQRAPDNQQEKTKQNKTKADELQWWGAGVKKWRFIEK